ncbi:MAG: hypothetical protein ACXW2T_06155 [Allosphingosinicella sp.]
MASAGCSWNPSRFAAIVREEGDEMTLLRIAAATTCALAIAGCATSRREAPPLGYELVGHQVRMQTSRGQVSTLTFRDDLTVRAQFGQNSVTGRWRVGEDGLCFWWGNAARECWPYVSPLRSGETRDLTSDRGNRVTITLD